jgi:hypothetical protein
MLPRLVAVDGFSVMRELTQERRRELAQEKSLWVNVH